MEDKEIKEILKIIEDSNKILKSKISKLEQIDKKTFEGLLALELEKDNYIVQLVKKPNKVCPTCEGTGKLKIEGKNESVRCSCGNGKVDGGNWYEIIKVELKEIHIDYYQTYPRITKKFDDYDNSSIMRELNESDCGWGGSKGYFHSKEDARKYCDYCKEFEELPEEE